LTLDDEIDALYSELPVAFLDARKALSVRAKKAGDKEGAARVAALAKPTLAAWAVNQLHREAKGEMDELFALGTALRKAHRRGAGGVRDVFQTQQAQRAAIDALTRRAQSILEKVGLPASELTLARVGETLTSVSTLNRWGEGKPGQLSRELSPPGFDALLEVLGELADEEEASVAKAEPKVARPVKPAKPAAASRAASREPPRDELGARRAALEARRKLATEAREAAEVRVAEAKREAARAETEASETKREADESRRLAKDAEIDARRLADAVKVAEEALTRAKRDASDAAKKASDAGDRAEAAQRSADESSRAKKAAAERLAKATTLLESARHAESAVPGYRRT